ncbi:MAG: hypothetical protein WAU36_12045 [Cyclobacteriaceae bacterium]
MQRGLIISGIAVLLLIVWLGVRNRKKGTDFFGGSSPRGITKLIQDDGRKLKGNIAGVNRHTGEMYINMPLVKQRGITKDQLFFIMLHEMGHMKLQTSDEVAVDEWAHKEYMSRGYSLNQSVTALTQVLRFNKEEDYIRGEAQLRRAQAYDKKKAA